MGRRGSPVGDRYSTVAIVFHWTTAALVLVNLAIGLLHDAIGGMGLHKSIGLTVLALTVLRIVWRLGHRPPPLEADVPAWQRHVARVTHWLLYILMVMLPLSGWAMVSGGVVKRPLGWFGLFDVPLLPVDAASAAAAHDRHVQFGWAMLALVALHVGAALYHHLVRRDRTLLRMAPALER